MRRVAVPATAGLVAFSVVVGFLAICPKTDAPAIDGSGAIATVAQAFGQLPLYFEPNLGQAHSGVEFLSRRGGSSLYLTSTGFLLKTPPGPRAGAIAVRMRLVGGNPESVAEGLDVLPGRSNYLVGSDRESWRTDIPHYSRIRFENVYDGIDLVFHGDRGALEYDFVVAPGIDFSQIRLAFEGAEAINIDPDGNLVLATAAGDVIQELPYIYQTAGGDVPGDLRVDERLQIPGRYLLADDGQVGFEVPSYDSDLPLVIDPALSYSSYAGGGGNDQGTAIAVDDDGNAYVAGRTNSIDFPTSSSPFQATLVAQVDVFVSKLDPLGSNLVYSTYLGGGGNDLAQGIAIDSAGNAYVVGRTDSTNFPTANALQGSLVAGALGDVFVAKLAPSGSALVYSTYVGGSDTDIGMAVAVDATGSAYVVGETASSDFPTVNPIQTQVDPSDAFMLKLNPAGGGPVYSTYFGGNGVDRALAVAPDGSGNAYVVGMTSSNNIPFLSKIQPLPGGGQDVFVVRVNAAGSAFPSFSYLGGLGEDVGTGIAVDLQGNTYLSAQTSSSDFPTTPGAYQTVYHGGRDTAVAKVNPAGDTLLYSTYIGGASNDDATGLAIDRDGNAYVTGETFSTDYPTARPFQATNAGGDEIFLTKFNATGSGLIYSTYIGGGNSDIARAVAVDAGGSAYVTGSTTSTDFPTARPVQGAPGGGTDAFVLKLVEPLDFWIAESRSEFQRSRTVAGPRPFRQ